MKKILFMVSSMNIGGVEKSLLSLLSAIPKEKYDITLLILEEKGGFLEYVPDWVKVERASWFEFIEPIIMQPPQKTLKYYFSKSKYIKIFTFIASYLLSKHLKDRHIILKHIFKGVPINSMRYDVAIAYQGPTETIDYYILNKVDAKQKISWVHFDVSQFHINKKLYSKLYSKFNKIFIVSEEAKKRLIELIPSIASKIDVFRNIVSKSLISEMSKVPVEFDEDFKGIKLLTVGRLSREKGQDLAVKVLSRLRRDGYNVRWYCIGEGKERNLYDNLIDKYNLKDDFVLLGSRVNPYSYMSRSDIYVQTSRHEGYCLTLAEARCLYKPIVTTNFTAAVEQITDGYNGFIVGCNEEELYKRIKLMIDSPSIRSEFIRNLSSVNINTIDEVNKLFTYID
jgi:glycosyltransferase involved in cell wall biosynthesis